MGYLNGSVPKIVVVSEHKHRAGIRNVVCAYVGHCLALIHNHMSPWLVGQRAFIEHKFAPLLCLLHVMLAAMQARELAGEQIGSEATAVARDFDVP